MARSQEIEREAYAGNIASATRELRDMQIYTVPENIRSCLRAAVMHVKFALSWANRMQDAALRSSCLRLLNWLRADLRRLA